MPTCDEYLGAAKGHCPATRAPRVRFCTIHAAERETSLRGSTSFLDD